MLVRGIKITDHFIRQAGARFGMKEDKVVSWFNNRVKRGVILHNANAGRMNRKHLFSTYIYHASTDCIIVIATNKPEPAAITVYKGSECGWFKNYKKSIGDKFNNLEPASLLFPKE